MAGRAGPGQVGVAPEELPHPPFGSDYRMKIKLQSLFLYCYTKEVVSLRSTVRFRNSEIIVRTCTYMYYAVCICKLRDSSSLPLVNLNLEC